MKTYLYYTVNYEDPEAGAWSPIDNFTAPDDYKEKQYIDDCDKNGAEQYYVDMLKRGRIHLLERDIEKEDYTDVHYWAVNDIFNQNAVNGLGFWFERYGSDYWNGEYYDCDNNRRLFPIYEHDPEHDQYDIVGYEFK